MPWRAALTIWRKKYKQLCSKIRLVPWSFRTFLSTPRILVLIFWWKYFGVGQIFEENSTQILTNFFVRCFRNLQETPWISEFSKLLMYKWLCRWASMRSHKTKQSIPQMYKSPKMESKHFLWFQSRMQRKTARFVLSISDHYCPIAVNRCPSIGTSFELVERFPFFFLQKLKTLLFRRNLSTIFNKNIHWNHYELSFRLQLPNYTNDFDAIRFN